MSLKRSSANTSSTPQFEQQGRSASSKPIHITARRLGSVNSSLLNYSPRREAILADKPILLKHIGSYRVQASRHLLILQ